jgi:hypothetical protein
MLALVHCKKRMKKATHTYSVTLHIGDGEKVVQMHSLTNVRV